MALDVRDPVAGVEFVPAAVEVFGDEAELDDQNGRQVGVAASPRFLLPEPQQGFLVLAHDDAGIRAADEVTPIEICVALGIWIFLSQRFSLLITIIVVSRHVKRNSVSLLKNVMGDRINR